MFGKGTKLSFFPLLEITPSKWIYQSCRQKMISNKSLLCRFCEFFFCKFQSSSKFHFSQQMYEILPITIRFHKHYCYEKMLKLEFVQERAGNIPVTFYLWWWAQPSICPWYLSFPLKQKRAFSAMQSIWWWIDLDKNMEKKSIIIWHMGCSFTSTIKRVGDTTAMPVLHYLTTTNGCQCAPCVHTLKLSLCFPWHTNTTLPLHSADRNKVLMIVPPTHSIQGF
jgi:hypothetical protein